MRTSDWYIFIAFVFVLLTLGFGVGWSLFWGIKEENSSPPSEVANSYGGQTYRECESGWGPKHCYAYIFDEGGDEVCAAQIPNTRAAQREIDLAAITCRED